MKKLNLDIKSIDKIILNYSLENIEEKLDLLEIKKKKKKIDYPKKKS